MRDKIKKILKEETENNKEPFTEEERETMDLLVDATNKFNELEETHPSDKKEWEYHIHALQKILGMRTLRRDYPDEFPNKSNN